MSRCSGRVAVAALFQTADEMRRVHRLAYRMRQLQESHARFGFESRAVWQEDPIWQPLPEVVERHHPGLDARWHPSVQRAVASFAPLFGEGVPEGRRVQRPRAVHRRLLPGLRGFDRAGGE
ncbi:MAG: hypothetical protein E6J81_11295 [Deltaproteobacteria bacterium]|nr:MAG: hypothetical protein E6J81_11295 [Deltaproteobacteria bacterium]